MNSLTNIEDLAVLVPSCDKFYDVWPHFFHFLFNYWPNFNQKLYLISNHQKFDHPKVTPILMGEEKSWSDNVLIALQNIKENYVLIILEDFLLTGLVDKVSLSHLLNLMRQQQAGYCRLMSNPPPDIELNEMKGVGYIKKEAQYRTSLQVALWDKKVLKNLLKTGESPWAFELNGTKRSRELKVPFLSINNEFKQPIPYFPNSIVRGKWVKEALLYLQSHDRSLMYPRPIEKTLEAFVRKNILRDTVSKWLVQPIKKMLIHE